MRIYIVRHGETLENLERICQGQSHGHLSKKGLQQAKAIASRLQDTHFTALYTSDLKRAKITAKIIAKQQRINLPFYESCDLRERYFGSFEGSRFPDDLQNFVPPPETETVEQIRIRLKRLITESLQIYPNDSNLLLVSHGFTIKVLLSLFKHNLEKDLKTLDDIANASLSIVEFGNDLSNVRILLENNISHLMKESLF